MNFEILKGQLRSHQRKSGLVAPAIVESLEVRSLLTVLSPTGTVGTSTPVITWEAIDGAVSYDLWVSDAEQRTVQLNVPGISGTEYVPTTELNLGRARAWVRTNFAGGVQSAWSSPVDFVVQVPPTVTGPMNSGLPGTSPEKIVESKPTITWTSPPGAFKFEIFLSDQTRMTSETIAVKNLTPVLDPDGKPIPDGKGDVLREEVRSYTLADDLPMGSYRVFVRTFDDGGRVTAWSPGFNFEVATQVKILRPSAPTFQTASAVEVSVNGTPTSGSYTISLTIPGVRRASTTTALPYNATTSQVQSAVRNLQGFGSTIVTTTGLSPNLTHLLSFPSNIENLNSSVAASLNSGAVTARTTSAQKILLEWEPVEGATHYEVWVSKAGQTTSIYSARYLTTTSYQIPDLLPDGDYVFSVRARRLHQVTEIHLAGTPTSGTYRIELTTFGKDGKTQQTVPIRFDATAAQIKAAIIALSGFKNADVVSQGSTPALKHLIQIPQTSGTVKVKVVGSISPGTLTSTTYTRPEVIGVWSKNSEFSTIKAPVIIAPKGIASNIAGQPLVTDVRPTIEWTPIDKAARYEIWVEVSNGLKPYLQTKSSANSYQFEQDIKPGKYQVWVRAVSTTGILTGWSEAYAFEATGGAPVITSPAANAAVLPIPDITWTAVPDADSYEIWFAWVGEDYDYIVADGIASTNYSPADPLPTGTYRVWVRAIRSDGSALPWSKPITFSVAVNGAEQIAADSPILLTALLSRDDQFPSEVVVETLDSRNLEPESMEHPNNGNITIESVTSLPAHRTVMTAETEALIQQLAQQCATEEWWMPQGSGT